MENERHTFEVIRKATRSQAISDIENHVDYSVYLAVYGSVAHVSGPLNEVSSALHNDVRDATRDVEYADPFAITRSIRNDFHSNIIMATDVWARDAATDITNTVLPHPAIPIEQSLHEDVKKMTYQSETSNIIHDATLMATRAVVNPACDEKIKSEVYRDTAQAIRRVFPSVLIREAVKEAIRQEEVERIEVRHENGDVHRKIAAATSDPMLHAIQNCRDNSTYFDIFAMHQPLMILHNSILGSVHFGICEASKIHGVPNE